MHSYHTYDRHLTSAVLIRAARLFGMDGETLADHITGLNCDTYADESCDVMSGWFCDCAANGPYEGDATGHWQHVIGIINGHCDNNMELMELWHRCLNIHIADDNDVRKGWEDGNSGTLLGMLDSTFYQRDLEPGLQAIYWDEDNDITPDYDTMVTRYKQENNL